MYQENEWRRQRVYTLLCWAISMRWMMIKSLFARRRMNVLHGMQKVLHRRNRSETLLTCLWTPMSYTKPALSFLRSISPHLWKRWSPPDSLQNHAHLQHAPELHEDREGIERIFFPKEILSITAPRTAYNWWLNCFSYDRFSLLVTHSSFSWPIQFSRDPFIVLVTRSFI